LWSKKKEGQRERESEDDDVECGIERNFEKDLGTKRKLKKEG
jgi:hypothetical protein